MIQLRYGCPQPLMAFTHLLEAVCLATTHVHFYIAPTIGHPTARPFGFGANSFTAMFSLRSLSNPRLGGVILVGIAWASGLASAAAQNVTPRYAFSHLAGPVETSGSLDGAGSSARFLRPSGVAIDRFGAVYIADTASGTIRKILSNGTVTTQAGSSGAMGKADGTGSAARFDSPSAVAFDFFGTLYIADTNNNTIRTMSPSGVVTTLAGSGQAGSADGTGTAAQFYHPSGIAVDNGGNVYVADTLNQTIRKITAQGVVSTLAGSPGVSGSADGAGGTARFSSPTGIAVDSGGRLYITDSQNNTVRTLTPGGVVTTLVGTAGQSGHVDAVGVAARFNYPTGIVVDTDGSLYVADGTSTIRKVTSTGVVTTLVGTADAPGSADGSGVAARFSAPRGLGIDSVGDIYVADTNNDSVRFVTRGGQVSTLAGAPPAMSVDAAGSLARFNLPVSAAVDLAGNVYIADSANDTIRKIDPSGLVSTLAGSPGLAGSSDGTGAAARFSSPSALAVDRAGILYVADAGNDTIRKISPSGMVTTFAGTSGARGSADGTGTVARFDRPSGIAVDSAGIIYVSDSFNHTIRKITPQGAVTTFVGTADQWGSVDGTGSAARLFFPGALAVDTASNLYVVDQDRVIRKITSAGVVTTLAGSPSAVGSLDGTGSSARFDHPAGIAVSSTGILFVADSNNQTIRSITPAGLVSTVGGIAGQIGSTDGPGNVALFNHPSGIAVDLSGNLYVADTYNDAVRKGVPDLPSPLPMITSQPAAQSAVTGGRAIFSVTATNALSYQWTKDGVVIPGATSSTFVIPSAQAADAGTYRVTITGAAGTVQSVTAILTVTDFTGVRLVNISTRSYVGSGGDVMIAGFIIGGTAPKTVLIRASGPALAQFNLSGLLADPTLELHSGNTILASNDNWGDEPVTMAAITQASLSAGVFSWSDGSKDAAIVTTLNPGGYTAIVAGKNGTTGLALIEVFEIDLANGVSKLINLSTRSVVMTDANVQIAGFVIEGTGPKKVIVRASGPALTKYNVTGVLADPVLELHNTTTILATNDDWAASLSAEFQKVGIDNWAQGSKDAAIVMTLDPGPYTAIVSGKGNTTGVALIEVFETD